MCRIVKRRCRLVAGSQEIMLRSSRAKKGVDTPDNAGFNPLHFAAQNGHAEVAKALIADGTAKSVDTPDSAGFTPLQVSD